MSNIADYGETHAAFRWETPERFNFGRDVVDAWPGDRPAMTWLGANGGERRLTFGNSSRFSERFANAMRDLDVGRGEPVMAGREGMCQASGFGRQKSPARGYRRARPNPVPATLKPAI